MDAPVEAADQRALLVMGDDGEGRFVAGAEAGGDLAAERRRDGRILAREIVEDDGQRFLGADVFGRGFFGRSFLGHGSSPTKMRGDFILGARRCSRNRPVSRPSRRGSRGGAPCRGLSACPARMPWALRRDAPRHRPAAAGRGGHGAHGRSGDARDEPRGRERLALRGDDGGGAERDALFARAAAAAGRSGRAAPRRRRAQPVDRRGARPWGRGRLFSDRRPLS